MSRSGASTTLGAILHGLAPIACYTGLDSGQGVLDPQGGTEGPEDGPGAGAGGSGGSAGSESQGPGDGPPGQGTDGSDGTDGGEEVTCAGERPLGPAPLRRFTPAQYGNTVRDLFPAIALPTLTFAADPKSHGFENFGALQVPSALWVDQLRAAAATVARLALETPGVVPCGPGGGSDPLGCGRTYLGDLGRRAFRRPLAPDEASAYLDFFATQLTEHGYDIAMRAAIAAYLQAPPFLYFTELDVEPVPDRQGVDKLGGYALASRLSYLLWNTMPDEPLLAAASQGALSTREQVEAEARRMLADPRVRQSVREFHRQWMGLDKVLAIAPDVATYPTFEAGLRDDLAEELLRFIEQVVVTRKGSMADLYTSRKTFVTSRLAALYGVTKATTDPWEPVELPASERAGLLTRAGWLAARAHVVHPSPVQRGVFVLDQVLCAPPPPPPPDVNTKPPEDDQVQAATNRQRYDAHILNDRCRTCHKLIDPIGFGFEHYDSLGRFRAMDGGSPVDASGKVLAFGTFDGAVELSELLGTLPAVRACTVKQYVRYALGRETTPDDGCELDELERRLEGQDDVLVELLVAIASSDSFRYRRRTG